MVQKKGDEPGASDPATSDLAAPARQTPRRRGRPPAYDTARALDAAMDVFWTTGYEGASLDAISAATGMNRPSLYGAFGDKKAIYLKTLERYREASREAIRQTLAPDRPLREGLLGFYRRILDVYLAGPTPRGCYSVGTATTEAVKHADVRAFLAEGNVALDRAFERRFRLGAERGELPAGADPASLARLATAVIHTLAVRSRVGDSRESLESTAKAAVDLICGPDDAGHSEG